MPEAPAAPPPAAPAAVAPPAAPAAAPAAPAKAAPSPNAGPRSSPAKNMADAFSKLDAMATSGAMEDSFGKNPPKAPAGKEPQSAKDKNIPPVDPETLNPEPRTSNLEQPEPPVDPARAGEPAKPLKAATLREAHDRMKAEMGTLQKKLAEYEAERAKPPVEDVEKRKLGETLAQREKRLAELEDDLRFTNYERSGEYQEKYFKPFEEAWQDARGKIAAWKVIDDVGDVRPGTAADFDAFVQIVDDDKAADRAVEIFGNKAAIALSLRQDVHKLGAAKTKALEHFRKEGKNIEAQRAETSKATLEKTSKEAQALWTKFYSEPHEKLPQYFKPIEGDTKGNELLDNGFAQTAEAFRNMNAMDPRLSAADREKVIKGHAIVFNKAAAFDRLAHLYHSEKSQRAAAEAKLKEFEESGPGGGDTRGKNGKSSTARTMDAALDALTKLAR